MDIRSLSLSRATAEEEMNSADQNSFPIVLSIYENFLNLGVVLIFISTFDFQDGLGLKQYK